MAVPSTALFAIGCGEENSAAGGTEEIVVETGSLSKTQFIERADAICEKGRAQFEGELGAFARSSPAGASEREQAEGLIKDVMIPAYEDQIQKVRALGAPRGDEEQVGALLTAMQRDLDRGRADPLAYARSNDSFPTGRKLAREYGLEFCPT